MPTHTSRSCAHRPVTEALARGALHGDERTAAERHLERCQACRGLFHQCTARRFPKIRNYTFLTEIGRGGFGIVYKALHHTKERTEALKILFGSTAVRTAYFENEVRLVARLRHPNIATLYDASLGTAPLYYAMEFVEGQQLDEYFRSHEVSLEERIALIKTVAVAVGYAHEQGVIHRDLKPQNILIDSQGQPRIVDFGIAKRLGLDAESDRRTDGVQRPEAPVGTYGYISPEQLAGQNADLRADIYSLGALLFHVITGQPARFAPEPKRLREVLHERRVSRADDLAAIIACCVRPAPDQRYPDCVALVADLDSYLAGRPIQARPHPTPGYRVARIATLVIRNYPRPVQVVAVSVLACVMTGLVWASGARMLPMDAGRPQTALIAFTSSTLEALRSGRLGTDLPGLDLRDSKSFRLLYGQLMEKLAVAQPRVVVWDYFFAECRPEFDARFVQGLRAMQAPVIIGDKSPDLNGEPSTCPEIRAAIHAWGILAGTRPGENKDAVYIPLTLLRGYNPPIPSLALAAFAAARYPDCELEIHPRRGALDLRYRRRHVVAGELRYPHPSDAVPLVKTETAAPDDPQGQPGDRHLFAGFHLETIPQWAARPIPMEDVLAADATQLRNWFAGHAVLIGQALPYYDQHELEPGHIIFGCQVQAIALNDLLRGALSSRLSSREVAALVCVSCLVAALFVSFLPTRVSWARPVVNLAALGVLALFAASWYARRITEPWTLGTVVATCSLLAAGAVTLIIKLLHQRQLHLTPAVVWTAENGTASIAAVPPSPHTSTASTDQ